MTITTNLIINQGSSFSQTLNYVDDQGDPVNLTGYFLRGYIKETYSSTNAFALTLNYANAAVGSITVTLSSQDTSFLDGKRYVYDIEGYQSSSDIIRLFEGIVTVNPGVSQLSRPAYIVNRETYLTANLVPKEDLIYDLGSEIYRYKNLFLGNAIITTEGSNLLLPANTLFGGLSIANLLVGETLVGATGPTGPAGTDGIDGATGPTGPVGRVALFLDITANSNVSYYFSGPGITEDNTENPTIYAYRGFTYDFYNQDQDTHPLKIYSELTGNLQIDGVLVDEEANLTTLTVPFNITGNLYYQSNVYPSMGGNIIIL